jgi:hypothetical protein
MNENPPNGVVDRINRHLQALAPHVARRETAELLRLAVDEIERLRNRKLVNPGNNPRYDEVYEDGLKMLGHWDL